MLILTCDHCGRTFAPDDGVLLGDDCPAEDCPSHEDESTAEQPAQPLVVDGWRLVDAAGDTCHIGQVVTDFRYTPAILEGGTPPHKQSSTGFIHVNRGSYYPSVYGLRWVKEAV